MFAVTGDGLNGRKSWKEMLNWNDDCFVDATIMCVCNWHRHRSLIARIAQGDGIHFHNKNTFGANERNYSLIDGHGAMTDDFNYGSIDLQTVLAGSRKFHLLQSTISWHSQWASNGKYVDNDCYQCLECSSAHGAFFRKKKKFQIKCELFWRKFWNVYGRSYRCRVLLFNVLCVHKQFIHGWMGFMVLSHWADFRLNWNRIFEWRRPRRVRNDFPSNLDSVGRLVLEKWKLQIVAIAFPFQPVQCGQVKTVNYANCDWTSFIWYAQHEQTLD